MVVLWGGTNVLFRTWESFTGRVLFILEIPYIKGSNAGTLLVQINP